MLPWQNVLVLIRSNQNILPELHLQLSKFGNFWLERNKMATGVTPNKQLTPLFTVNRNPPVSSWQVHNKYIVGRCGWGVEPASCYLFDCLIVTGLIPLVCMLKCAWQRHWTANCSWSAGWHLAWQPPPCMAVWMYVWITLSCFGQKCLLNVNVT